MPYGNANDSLYFTDQGWAGGEVFVYWHSDVRQYQIDNAKLLYWQFRSGGLQRVSALDAISKGVSRAVR
jgi:1,4-alpha-glucan branching enzyme